jgi:hypothetical protein
MVQYREQTVHPDCAYDCRDDFRQRVAQAAQYNESRDVSGVRASGDPNPDLACALTDRVRHDTVDTDGCRQERDRRERAHEPHANAACTVDRPMSVSTSPKVVTGMPPLPSCRVCAIRVR